MEKSFGKAFYEKLVELRYPKDHRFLESFKVYPLPIVGCTDEEITFLRELQQVSALPEIFVEFLIYMGKASGDLFIGYDIGHQYMGPYDMKSDVNELLEWKQHTLLTDTHFVFMNLQGHSFWFFPTDEGNDPPVYAYYPDDGSDDPEFPYPYKDGPAKVSDYLSEFLTMFIRQRDSHEAQVAFLEKYAEPYRNKTE